MEKNLCSVDDMITSATAGISMIYIGGASLGLVTGVVERQQSVAKKKKKKKSHAPCLALDQ
jgi:hypothetical protein